MAAVEPVAAAGRTPPHSLAAEQAVLGSLMMHPPAWDELVELVAKQDFYHPAHRTIFGGIAALVSASRPPDFINLIEWLTSRRQLDDAGGRDYLAGLADNITSAVNVLDYARIVKENSILRRLGAIGIDIARQASAPEAGDAQKQLGRAEQEIFELAHSRGKAGDNVRSIGELLADAVDRIEHPAMGLHTGFKDFDELLAGGLMPGDLIIIAGRPAMGKSALAVNIAEYVALREQRKVAVFSMEMSSQMLAIRILSSMARIDQQLLRTGRLKEDDWTRLSSAVSQLHKAAIFIDDTPALSPGVLASMCRRIARQQDGLDLIIVDYLQLMRVPGMSDNRVAEISEISRSLKELAKGLNIPIIALSQMNRSADARIEHRPVMSDLRESGAIEQDADLIIFIYRDEMYDKDTKHPGEAELIIGKQRNGPTGTALLTFLGAYTRFENMAREQEYPEYAQDLQQ